MYILAIINLYTYEDSKYQLNVIEHESSAVDWLLNNVSPGENFEVYAGPINKRSEISRDINKVREANEVSIFILPAAGAIYVAYAVAAIIAVVALTATPSALSNVNRTQESPNNSLTDRNNVARPNQRIPDICGKVKSVCDVLSREYTRYVDDVEERIGYYCVGKNDLLIEDIKETDTLFSDMETASAGVYAPYQSPNNAQPYIQIGDTINESVYGVTQSPNATGQTLEASNLNTVVLDGGATAHPEGYILSYDSEVDFTENFQVGASVNLNDIKIDYYDPTGELTTYTIGDNTSIVTSVSADTIYFDISDDTSWANISAVGDTIQQRFDPEISEQVSALIGPFKMTTTKINRLIVNVSALNGMYKEDSSGLKVTSTSFQVKIQKLDDNGDPIGSISAVQKAITGNDATEKGETVDIYVGSASYVEWSVQRASPKDFGFDGTIVDEIALKSVFGLTEVSDDHFGNVTTIQTKRTNAFLATATQTPELNCIATELVQKYENGSFATEFTPNTQAMQSLIRLALDPYVGRRSESELDLDLLVSLQDENEEYFESTEAGEFNYTFDSTNLSAQETFASISKAAFITLWREGRVLKGWFESPQSIPSMVFTHRSKELGNETWSRKRGSSDSKDSIEFTYTDADLYTKETLFYPEDQSGTNPERIETTGVKGLTQATIHMMREYNKQKYQEITVDFGATKEGRFVKPESLISVVKGARIYTYDGNIVSMNGLLATLSQNVAFTDGDTHSVILKHRDGSTESILVTETTKPNVIQFLSTPLEEIYTGNDALKTEFSFGNESRLSGQLMIAKEIAPNGDFVNISAVNYSSLYYQDDLSTVGRAYSTGYDSGFS